MVVYNMIPVFAAKQTVAGQLGTTQEGELANIVITIPITGNDNPIK